MNVPPEDMEKWKSRLVEAAPSVVLREMAAAYNANKSALGFMFTDLCSGDATAAAQAVWGWDIGRTGRGLSDAELDELLTQKKA